MSGYPPTGGYPGYTPSSGYPPTGAPPPSSGYPPTNSPYAIPPQQGYPPTSAPPSSTYPTGQPPGSSGYPPTTGYTPSGYPPTNPQSGYPPTNPSSNPSGYPPSNPSGYPPSSAPSGYPPQNPSAYPPSSAPSGYPPASNYPPTNPQSGYPPQNPSGYPPGSTYPPPPQQGPQAWYGQYYNQINPQDMQALSAWFASVDRDRSGEISVSELASLNFNNRLLGQESARKLIAIFDKDRSGSINFVEYASLQQFLNTLLAQFNLAERRGGPPGFITVNELLPALQASGFNLTPNSVTNFAKRFDTQKRGILSWEDFLALASHLALLKSVFEWSDSDRDGKVTFDFEAFVFATLYL